MRTVPLSFIGTLNRDPEVTTNMTLIVKVKLVPAQAELHRLGPSTVKSYTGLNREDILAADVRLFPGDRRQRRLDARHLPRKRLGPDPEPRQRQSDVRAAETDPTQSRRRRRRRR